jgi:hypothetical protein
MGARAMKIPRYILHPFLLTLAFGALFLLIRVPAPSAQEWGALNKKEVLNLKGMHQITELTEDGFLVIDAMEDQKMASQWKINDPRFENLTPEKKQKVKDFFIGRFIKINPANTEHVINLPVDLYDAACFSSSVQIQDQAQCPVVLAP